MDQIHKRFTVEQAKVYFSVTRKGSITRTESEEILQINKTRFFALLKEYRQDPSIVLTSLTREEHQNGYPAETEVAMAA